MSDPDVGMKNECPDCRECGLCYLRGALSEICDKVAAVRNLQKTNETSLSARVEYDAIEFKQVPAAPAVPGKMVVEKRGETEVNK